MPLLSVEHSPTAYRGDAFFYGMAVLGLVSWMVLGAPEGTGAVLMGWGAAGLMAWSALEYGLHRFVLHGLAPFEAWHLEHHRRPAALIRTPTWLSACLMVLLVWLPGVLVLGAWSGSAFTLGVMAGYLGYGLTHNAMHHGQTGNRWLQDRKYWHARHHHAGQPCCYGVTSSFWDHVFRTHSRKPGARVKVPVVRHNG